LIQINSMAMNCAHQNGPNHVIDKSTAMESTVFRKWLAERGCRFDRHEHERRHEGHASAVFLLLSDKIGAGEIDKIRHALPKDLRALWPTRPKAA
jgi:uncharacterized protein (DUF2267 family)